jgi:hypothetical protein
MKIVDTPPPDDQCPRCYGSNIRLHTMLSPDLVNRRSWSECIDCFCAFNVVTHPPDHSGLQEKP